mmetsp:Transcript_53199/g.124646  ORF Transcript_53199/g.124646 Transcript_53199/m.124646 type:complete len:220 (-) Transcript_53199:53-712(-)
MVESVVAGLEGVEAGGATSVDPNAGLRVETGAEEVADYVGRLLAASRDSDATSPDLLPLEAYLAEEKGAENSESAQIWHKLLFDAANEAGGTLATQRLCHAPVMPSLCAHARGHGAVSAAAAAVSVDDESVVPEVTSRVARWYERAREVPAGPGRDVHANVIEALLEQVAVETDHEWLRYERDEDAVGVEVTEAVWDDLLTDIVHSLMEDNEQRHTATD